MKEGRKVSTTYFIRSDWVKSLEGMDKLWRELSKDYDIPRSVAINGQVTTIGFEVDSDLVGEDFTKIVNIMDKEFYKEYKEDICTVKKER